MKMTGKLWLWIAVLVLLSPLGLILPAWFGSGSTWGEWSTEELRRMLGFVPAGMERLSQIWKAPLSGYVVPGGENGIVTQGLGYIATAVIGLALTAGFAYIAAKLLGRRDD